MVPRGRLVAMRVVPISFKREEFVLVMVPSKVRLVIRKDVQIMLRKEGFA